MHGERRQPFLAVEGHPVQRVPGDADRAPVCARDRPQGPGGIPAEPPVELGTAHRGLAPRLAQEPQIILPLGRLVRRQLVRHYLVDVPSAALNNRRACVPVTVSFTEMRSHAPASTSSNVRGEYGSML